MLQRCLWSNFRLSRPRFLRDCNCVVIELTAPPVFRRVRTVSGGCYIPLMAYCAVEEVKTGMRRSAIKVNTFSAFPVNQALLPTKYIKRLW